MAIKLISAIKVTFSFSFPHETHTHTKLPANAPQSCFKPFLQLSFPLSTPKSKKDQSLFSNNRKHRPQFVQFNKVLVLPRRLLSPCHKIEQRLYSFLQSKTVLWSRESITA